LEGEWRRLRENDVVLFYCTAPVSGVTGVGRVTAKTKQDTPFWPDEIDAKKVIYPFRFEFRTLYLVPESEWKDRRIKGSEIGLVYPHISRGLNEVTSEVLAKELGNRVLGEFGVSLDEVGRQPPAPLPKLDHSGVQQMVFELGNLQRFISHKEYLMGKERLDVVWRRVEGSVPTYAFEVQVGGDLHHALGKLKHAYDIWNSHTILILPPEDIPKARELLSGTFHEARDRVKLITLDDLRALYLKKREWSELERSLGILT
jgi:hypothetical protein